VASLSKHDTRSQSVSGVSKGIKGADSCPLFWRGEANIIIKPIDVRSGVTLFTIVSVTIFYLSAGRQPQHQKVHGSSPVTPIFLPLATVADTSF
jgi:hypothetical protein